MQSNHPWKLRIEHLGFSHIRMEWAKETIHFNPIEIIEDGEIAIVLWNWPEQLMGVRKSIEAGKSIKVIAPKPILKWLAQFGEVNGTSNYSHQGLNIELESYQPIPPMSFREGIRKVRSTARRPIRSIRRLKERDSLPDCPPQIAWIRFPSGVVFAHLHLSLHQDTPAEWLEKVSNRAKDAQWVMIGCDYELSSPFLERLSNFPTQYILLTDLIGDYRRKMGLPTMLLTPIADLALIKKLDVQVFATKVGYRFDKIELLESGETQ